MKLTDILRTASSNMLRSKLRTFLTVIAIFIGALTLALTNAIGAGVSSYIDKQLGNVGAEDALLVQPADTMEADGGGPQEYDPDASTSTGAGFSIPVLDEGDLETIRQQEGVLSAEPMLAVSPEYITAGENKYETMFSPYINGTNLDLAAGSLVDSASADFQTIIPVELVEPLGFSSAEAAIGQEVVFGVATQAGDIDEVAAKVVGVQYRTLLDGGMLAATGNDALMAALYDIQTRGLPEEAKNRYYGAVARFDINASDEQLQAIKDRLASEGYLALTIDDTIGIVKQVIDAIIAVLNFFAAIALLAASFGIINTLLMAVQERTKEIGLMKAMGMGGGKIFLLFSTEAVLLGFWGSVLGIAAAYGIGQIANKIASESFLQDLPGFELMVFPLESMAIITLIIMGVAFIAGTLPARRAARQNPIDALRYE